MSRFSIASPVLTCLMSPLLIASPVLTCDMTIRSTNHVDGIGVEIRSANHDVKSDVIMSHSRLTYEKIRSHQMACMFIWEECPYKEIGYDPEGLASKASPRSPAKYRLKTGRQTQRSPHIYMGLTETSTSDVLLCTWACGAECPCLGTTHMHRLINQTHTL